MITHENLLTEYKEEKDSKKKERLFAICQITINKKSITHVAEMTFKAYNAIKDWYKRFLTCGTSGLEDKPRSGRPPKLVNAKITDFMDDDKDHTFPKEIIKKIKDSTDVTYSESWIRQQLHEMGYSKKVPTAGVLQPGISQECDKLAVRDEIMVFVPKTGRIRAVCHGSDHACT